MTGPPPPPKKKKKLFRANTVANGSTFVKRLCSVTAQTKWSVVEEVFKVPVYRQNRSALSPADVPRNPQ